MKNLRISENVKMYFDHEYFGRIEIPIDRIEYEEKFTGEEFPSVYFTKKGKSKRDKDEQFHLCLSLACINISDHIEDNNRGAEAHAIERGYDNLDRYIVKDMCVEEIIWDNKGVQLYCTWEDCYGCRRMYCSDEYTVERTSKKNRLYAHFRRANFYF